MQSPFLKVAMSKTRLRGLEDTSLPAQENKRGTGDSVLSTIIEKQPTEPTFAVSQILLS